MLHDQFHAVLQKKLPKIDILFWGNDFLVLINSTGNKKIVENGNGICKI